MSRAPRSVLGVRLRVPNPFRRPPEVGARPGTLAVADASEQPKIRLIQYGDRGEVVDRAVEDPRELATIDTRNGVTWVDVQGLGDEAVLRTIADAFSIDALALEDMVNVPQRPKVVTHGERLLWVSRMVRFDEQGVIDREQIALFHDHHLLVSFQEKSGDILDPVRARIHDGKGRIRKSSADYLAYAILDVVVDGYYPIIANITTAMEEIEAEVMVNPSPHHLSAINQTRVLTTTLKRGMSAQREAMREFLADPSEHVAADNLEFHHDVLDHVNQLVDVLENQKEHLASLLNTYLSMVGYRANEVMKVLTIMASIFIPLTFIAGIYGMNFQHMPELAYPWAYPAALGTMFVVAIGMLVFFARRGWIGRGAPPRRPRERDD